MQLHTKNPSIPGDLTQPPVMLLTKCMALDGAPDAIRANCAWPGLIRTLAPDEARRVTGTALVVDGGLTPGVAP
jgi:NAD(P)-dependent dehydrogenase (short-subunit alcohol dehydrogenase family)